MEWSIQQIAQATGTTSRALRHYDQLGLVPPTRIGANGYRYYDQGALVRLQQVLLLRELGLGLKRIGEVLAERDDPIAVLTEHIGALQIERNRLDRQIAAVRHTIMTLTQKEDLMPETMFDGFDHTQFKDEVERRWGAEAYARSDQWWRGMDADERDSWRAHLEQLNRNWIALAEDDNVSAASQAAQKMAARHIEWLTGIPGTPAYKGAPDSSDVAQYVRSLAEMYVADERFAANYGGAAGARFVRDALVHRLDHSDHDE